MTTDAWRIGLLLGLAWKEPGGVQRVTLGLAREFMRRGHSVSILAFGEPGHEPREFMQRGQHVRLLPAAQAPDDWDGLNRRRELEDEALRWCADRELDVVHLMHLSGFGLGLPVRLHELGRQVFATLHDDGFVCPRGQMWSVRSVACEEVIPATCAPCWAQTWPQLGDELDALPAVERRLSLAREAVAACTRVFVPSSAARDVALAWGADPGQLEVCDNGVDGPCTTPVRRDFDATDLRVGVLGALQPSKGVLFLAQLMAELGAPFQLELHGPAGDYHGDRRHQEQLETLAAETDRVNLHGAYDPEQLPGILASLDLVCVPSLWHEVHGLVAREALLAGVPVFVAARGGLRDVPALQLPAGDAQAWKDALQRFVRDEVWRAEQVPSGLKVTPVAQAAEQHLAAYGAVL